MSSTRLAERALGLLLGCHPLPCVAVAAFATAYAAAIGAGVSRLVLIAVTVLAGQLVVGWSNDAIDAPRDIAAQRPDKPVSTGLVTGRTLALGAILAAIVCVVLSFRLGAAAGWLHLAAVVSAVGYNAGLKVTRLSPLPYLLSFGLLPVVVTLAVIGPTGRAPLSQVIAAALLGAAAHAGNTVGDAVADEATGVRGLPQRLGPQRSLVAMAGLVAGAAIVLLVTVLVEGEGSAGRRVVAVTLLMAGVVLATFGAVRRVGVATPASGVHGQGAAGGAGSPDPGGRDAWRLTLAAVALVVIGFLVAV